MFGENRAVKAAEEAINSPLLEVSIEGAKGVIFNITGGPDLTINEVHAASEVISRVVDPDANIIFGMVTDQKMENEVKLTIIATGFPSADDNAQRAQELGESLDAMDTEELDIPPFLRHHPAARRRLRTPVRTNGHSN